MGVTLKSSVNIGLKTGYSVLVTVAAGFVGIHISAALRCRGDYVLGLDNFNSYYDPTLKRARQHVWKKSGIFIVEGDIKDTGLLNKLFEPAIVWASSSSVYGLNTEVPFSEEDRTDPIRCNEEVGEEIAHTYNRIYGGCLGALDSVGALVSVLCQYSVCI
ncbi:putative UDP-glucuronate 4-epimerase [Helianthus annuus]|uniref:Putative NAD(P)-binding domain-containing protein n=1 Tax=Helianthus annuus TaxID=4232 RepID=A0A251SYU2_HELAN|nr:putative UDP-glucuronate 4-epimerase [Helianthus annuus]